MDKKYWLSDNGLSNVAEVDPTLYFKTNYSVMDSPVISSGLVKIELEGRV